MSNRYLVHLTTTDDVQGYWIVDAGDAIAALRVMHGRHWVKAVHAVRPYDDQRPHKTWSGFEFDPGAFVEVFEIDMNGFSGRELHPTSLMQGCLGKVIGHSTRVYLDEEGLEDEWIDFFIVRLTSPPPGCGHYVELANFELSPAVEHPPIVESDAATIGVAVPAQPQPTGDTRMAQQTQLNNIRKLLEMGYSLSDVYGDGNVAMIKEVPIKGVKEEVQVVIMNDGTVKEPTTHSVRLAQAQLSDVIFLTPTKSSVTDRYYADTHGDLPNIQPFVFDSVEVDTVCCGPFADLEAARRAANRLNAGNDLPNGVRPHMIQHALDVTMSTA